MHVRYLAVLRHSQTENVTSRTARRETGEGVRWRNCYSWRSALTFRIAQGRVAAARPAAGQSASVAALAAPARCDAVSALVPHHASAHIGAAGLHQRRRSACAGDVRAGHRAGHPARGSRPKLAGCAHRPRTPRGCWTWTCWPSDDLRRRLVPDLILPHPRLAERAFVLHPLCDVAPEWRHPAARGARQPGAARRQLAHQGTRAPATIEPVASGP